MINNLPIPPRPGPDVGTVVTHPGTNYDGPTASAPGTLYVHTANGQLLPVSVPPINGGLPIPLLNNVQANPHVAPPPTFLLQVNQRNEVAQGQRNEVGQEQRNDVDQVNTQSTTVKNALTNTLEFLQNLQIRFNKYGVFEKILVGIGSFASVKWTCSKIPTVFNPFNSLNKDQNHYHYRCNPVEGLESSDKEVITCVRSKK